MRLLAVGSAALVLAAGGRHQQAADQPLKVSAIRFYQPASATTTIEGVMEIRLDSLMRGGVHVTSYRVDVAVSDSAGLQLVHSSWTRSLPESAAAGHEITSVETFGFDAAPGRFQVRIRVVPSAGDSLERVVAVEAYRTRPGMSDLLLATRVRQPDTDTEPPRQGEIRRAGLMLRTAVPPRLLPNNATLSYYAELYPVAAVSGVQLLAQVFGANGQRVVGAAPRTVSFPAGGGLTRGSLDLSGLPPGDYRLRLSVLVGSDTAVTEAPFAMGSLQALAAAGSADVGARGDANDFFATASEAQLDSMEAPLIMVARRPGDVGLYRMLTVDGKRRFLRQFWSTPSMRVQGSVDQAAFYRLVDLANRLFHESGVVQLQGWNTDRGRIFIRNGTWDEQLKKPASEPMHFEVWKYTRDRILWYVFGDRTGVGNYVLLATNDVREQGLYQSDWMSRIGVDGARDAAQFLGIQINSN